VPHGHCCVTDMLHGTGNPKQVTLIPGACGSSKAPLRRSKISRQDGHGNVQRPRNRSLEHRSHGEVSGSRGGASGDRRWQAFQWALANGPMTVRCRAGARSVCSTVDTSGGAAWSSARVAQVSSLPMVSPENRVCGWSGSDVPQPREDDRALCGK
jgi:hypothetical protein